MDSISQELWFFFLFLILCFQYFKCCSFGKKKIDLVSRCSQHNDLEASSAVLFYKPPLWAWLHYNLLLVLLIYYFILLEDSALFTPLNSKHTTLMIYKFEKGKNIILSPSTINLRTFYFYLFQFLFINIHSFTVVTIMVEYPVFSLNIICDTYFHISTVITITVKMCFSRFCNCLPLVF